jgi:hypothetical protein
MKLCATAAATIKAVAHDRQNLMKSVGEDKLGGRNLKPGAGSGNP